MTFKELAEFCATQRKCDGCPKKDICDKQAVARKNCSPPAWLDKNHPLWLRDIEEFL